MPAIAADLRALPVSSVSYALLAGSVALALILLIAWTGLLYFKVLSLPENDRAHGLRVLREFTNLIKAVSTVIRSRSGPGDE